MPQIFGRAKPVPFCAISVLFMDKNFKESIGVPDPFWRLRRGYQCNFRSYLLCVMEERNNNKYLFVNCSTIYVYLLNFNYVARVYYCRYFHFLPIWRCNRWRIPFVCLMISAVHCCLCFLRKLMKFSNRSGWSSVWCIDIVSLYWPVMYI